MPFFAHGDGVRGSFLNEPLNLFLKQNEAPTMFGGENEPPTPSRGFIFEG